MKQISINQITDPTSLQPFTANSLKFLQDALHEDKAAIVKAIIITNLGSYSLTIPYVISGCEVTDSGKDVAAGEIFYGGKFFEVVAVNGTTNVAQLVLTKSQDVTADPVEFTDAVMKSVHDVYKYVATDAASGGDFTSAAFTSVYGSAKNTFLNLSVNQSTTSTSFIDLTGSTYTTPNDGITRTWMIQGKTNVSFSGSAGDGGKLNIMVDSVQKDVSQSYLDVVGSNIDLHVQTCTCFTLLSIPPNKIIKLQICSVNGGTIDFNENKFTVLEI